MKLMADDRVRTIAEDALKHLAGELEAGRSDTLQRYLDMMARFHRYSWSNVLLIQSQRPDATHVAGFHRWHELGRSVRKGEKGIMILAPVVVKEKDTVPGLEPIRSDQVLRLAGFRTTHVFDVSQTEGRPLPEFAKTTGDPKEFIEKLKTMIGREGITVQYDAKIAPAQGVSSGGHIRLMPGMEPAEEFSVLVHELAHEMLHHGTNARPHQPVVRETEAEAVSYVVCRAAGLNTNTAAADYIRLYKGDPKTLAESLSSIQETSIRIMRDLHPERFRTDGLEITREEPASPAR